MATPETKWDIMDRINQVMALGAIFLAGLIGLDSVIEAAGDAAPVVLDIAEITFAVLLCAALGWMVVLIIRKLALSRQSGSGLRFDDFTSELVRRACTASWAATLIFTLLLDNRLLGLLPEFMALEVTTGLIMAVMLLVYGVTFLVLDRRMNASTTEMQ